MAQISLTNQLCFLYSIEVYIFNATATSSLNTLRHAVDDKPRHVYKDQLRVEKGQNAHLRGKAHPNLKRMIFVLAALSTVLWKNYAAKLILVSIISGNT